MLLLGEGNSRAHSLLLPLPAADLIFAALDSSNPSPEAVQLLKQLGSNLSGPRGGRLLVLLAR